jgi:hypothetical protein
MATTIQAMTRRRRRRRSFAMPGTSRTSIGMAAMEDRRFYSFFEARINILLKVWTMIWEDGLFHEKS